MGSLYRPKDSDRRWSLWLGEPWRLLELVDMERSAETIREMWATAHTIFAEAFPYFNPADRLVVDEGTHRWKLTYVASQTSPDPQDVTRLELCFHLDSREMWISWLSVATRLRLSGVGAQLVKVAETIARATGVQSIRVFPLVSANSFWNKMGYAPHLRAARVLCKELSVSTPIRADVAFDQRRTYRGSGTIEAI